ncbi:CD44 antigen [Discoglossus pictus]
MSRLLWICAFGLCCLLSFAQAETVVSCRFKGVFHVEKDGRYRVTEHYSLDLCASLNSTLATMEQMQIAYESGFETCRYGWIEGNIVIPRHTKNPLCAANYVGIYILSSNITHHYDVYCYNSSETRDKACEPVIVSDLFSFQQKSIPSYDPSLEDTQKPFGTQNSDEDEDTGNYTASPTNNEYATDRADSGIQDHVGQNEQGTPNPDASSNQYVSVEPDTYESTEQTDDNSIYHSGDGKNHGQHEDQEPTQVYTGHEDDIIYRDQDKSGVNEDHEMHEDITTTTVNTFGYMNPDQDSKPNNDGNNRGVEGDQPNPTDFDNDDTSSQGGVKKQGKFLNSGPVYGDGSPDENDDKPRRGAAVPDWLIVTVALVSLGLILSVCIALNSTRSCGQKKKLVINGKKGSLEEGAMEHNGDAARSQEMVQLVSRDPTIDPSEQNNINQDNGRNMRDVDMKIGV